VPAEREQRAIARAKRLARSGRRSLRAIAAHLAREGYISRTGRPFVATQVVRMLAASGPCFRR
jgi:hypothetical protein